MSKIRPGFDLFTRSNKLIDLVLSVASERSDATENLLAVTAFERKMKNVFISLPSHFGSMAMGRQKDKQHKLDQPMRFNRLIQP